MNQTISTEEANPLAQRFMQSQQAKKNQDTNTEPSANGLGISDSKYEEIIKKSLATKGNNYLIKQVLKNYVPVTRLLFQQSEAQLQKAQAQQFTQKVTHISSVICS